jgi:HD-GYP domain-containing protein (c-di-GMP phosphodiesterase class II)
LASPDYPVEMSAATPTTAELDPEAGGLIEDARARATERLAGRDSRSTLLGALGFMAVAVPFALLSPTERSVSPGVLVLLVVAYSLAARVEFEVGSGFAVPTQVVFVPMLFVLPVGLVPLCVAVGFLLCSAPDFARGRVHGERALLEVFSAWHALGPAIVLGLAGEPAPTWSALPLMGVALLAQFAFDFASSAARARLAFDVSAKAQLRLTAPVYLVDAALAPAGFLFAIVAYDEPLAVLLVLPLLGLFAFFARERHSRIDHALELSHAYRGTAFLLGDVIEADDAYTGTHSRGVVELVVGVSVELGLDARSQQDAELTALLHDVGKIRIPEEIINKPGKLTDDEWEIMKTHTIEGERMLAQVGGLLGRVGHLVRSCHERWDGRGYPDGLAAEDIPLVARIVCACDAYNAMTTDRPYRAARSPQEALAEMELCAGTQFDPEVVVALGAVARRGKG